jgi:hypothetical protein
MVGLPMEKKLSCPIRSTVAAFDWWDWEKPRRTSIITVGAPVEFITEHLPSQELYSYSCQVGWRRDALPPPSSALKMEAESSSETSITIYQTIRCHISEDVNVPITWASRYAEDDLKCVDTALSLRVRCAHTGSRVTQPPFHCVGAESDITPSRFHAYGKG